MTYLSFSVQVSRICSVTTTCDHTGKISAFESRVDIHDGDIGGATIQHSKQCGEASKVRTISNARWNCDHRNGDPARDHRWQRSFHSSQDNQRVGRCKTIPVIKQPLWSRNSNINNQIDFAAHPTRCLNRLFSDRSVTRARRDHDHPTTNLWCEMK